MMVFYFGFKITIFVKTFGTIGLSGFSQNKISLKVFKISKMLQKLAMQRLSVYSCIICL